MAFLIELLIAQLISLCFFALPIIVVVYIIKQRTTTGGEAKYLETVLQRVRDIPLQDWSIQGNPQDYSNWDHTYEARSAKGSQIAVHFREEYATDSNSGTSGNDSNDYKLIIDGVCVAWYCHNKGLFLDYGLIRSQGCKGVSDLYRHVNQVLGPQRKQRLKAHAANEKQRKEEDKRRWDRERQNRTLDKL